MTKRVGFIGLGDIGWPMAAHVAKAYDCTVWNRTLEKAEAFAAENNAIAAGSPVGVVAASEVVITCLPTSKEVLDVVEQARDGWQDGQLLIDCTSGDPAGSTRVAGMLRARGVGFADAPVSGGVGGAERGELTVMIGGTDEDAARAIVVVDCFAKKAEHVGPVGAGHAVKAINQGLLAVNIQAAGEGLAALVKLGVSGKKALEVINASSGRSNVTENLFPNRVTNRQWPRTFRLALLDKDVGIAVKILEDNDVPSDVMGTAKRAFSEARKILGEEADHVEFVKVIEEKAGVEIQ